MDTVGSRVVPLTDESDLWKRHFSSAQMVIEAVPENLDLKHRCVRESLALNRYSRAFLIREPGGESRALIVRDLREGLLVMGLVMSTVYVISAVISMEEGHSSGVSSHSLAS